MGKHQQTRGGVELLSHMNCNAEMMKNSPEESESVEPEMTGEFILPAAEVCVIMCGVWGYTVSEWAVAEVPIMWVVWGWRGEGTFTGTWEWKRQTGEMRLRNFCLCVLCLQEMSASAVTNPPFMFCTCEDRFCPNCTIINLTVNINALQLKHYFALDERAPAVQWF